MDLTRFEETKRYKLNSENNAENVINEINQNWINFYVDAINNLSDEELDIIINDCITNDPENKVYTLRQTIKKPEVLSSTVILSNRINSYQYQDLFELTKETYELDINKTTALNLNRDSLPGYSSWYRGIEMTNKQVIKLANKYILPAVKDRLTKYGLKVKHIEFVYSEDIVIIVKNPVYKSFLNKLIIK